jgi:hypothetical protein
VRQILFHFVANHASEDPRRTKVPLCPMLVGQLTLQANLPIFATILTRELTVKNLNVTDLALLARYVR